ncbi:MAG: oligosaccharide flippase family protein [Pirellulaceae bacterium]|nr:oligosaccharide flippase family protein [Pirellulaceae bacterium]MDP7019370.1 oligosaccharide flippase family protein [Pirellulaceae bacterium]
MTENQQQRKHLNTTAIGGSIAMVSTIVFNGGRLAIAGLLTRLLGDTDYGLYVLGMSFFMLLSGVSVFGLPQAVVRWGASFYTNDELAQFRRLLNTCAALASVCAVFCGCLFYMFIDEMSAYVGSPALAPLLLCFLFTLPFFFATEILAATSRALHNILWCSLIKEILPVCFQAIGIAIIAWRGPTPQSAIAVFGASYFFAAVIGSVYLLRRYPRIAHRSQSALSSAVSSRAVVGFGATLSMITLAMLLRDRLGVLLIGKFLSPADAGVFFNASRLAILTTLFASAFNTILAPQASSLTSSGSTGTLNSLYQAVVRWSILFAFPFALLLIVFAPFFMQIFFGDVSAGAGSLLALLVAFRFAMLFAGAPSLILQMSGNQRYDLLGLGASVIGTAIVLYIALPRWGVFGAVVATSLMNLLVDAFRAAVVYAKFRVAPVSVADAIKYAAMFAPLVAAAFWLHQWDVVIPPVVISVGLAVVLAAFVSFNMEVEDWRLLRNFVSFVQIRFRRRQA